MSLMRTEKLAAPAVVDIGVEGGGPQWQLDQMLSVCHWRARRSRDWVGHVLRLLDAALIQLRHEHHSAHSILLEAAALFKQQFAAQIAQPAADDRGRLLAWQARKVCEHIDAHLTGPVRIADLCALIQRSEAHFSRSFRRTFGESPHAFVIRRRLELAAHYMLRTDWSLSEISLRCGFTDQAHLCKHFRQFIGQTPAAWRRTHKARLSGRIASAVVATA